MFREDTDAFAEQRTRFDALRQEPVVDSLEERGSRERGRLRRLSDTPPHPRLVMTYPYLFPAMWLLWAGYWWLSSHDAKRTERSESQASRLMHIVPLMLAALLLIVDRWPLPILLVRIYPWAAWEFWAGAAVTAAGLLFSVWARVHIGRNWSGIVTLKHDHDLVVTGPYQIVRHPIYAGLLVALVGSAFACGQWRGVLALVFALLAVSRKVAIEERWMRERFREKYDAYSRSVPALVPRMRRS